MTLPDLSLVIPVCSEAESLPVLFAEIDAALKPLNKTYEVILIDDGSRDRSWAIITEQSKKDSRYRGMRFRRNFGKSPALAAGFKDSRGRIVFTLDADLQDDPAEIPRFLELLEGGLDVVSGWKKIRHDPWHKVLPSRVFNAMVSRVTGVKLHDHNCGFKAYRAEVLKEVQMYGERHRFVPVLAAARGFKVGEIVIHHRARKFGRSHYGFRRFLKGFLDLVSVWFLTAFARRPQHLTGNLAVVPAAMGKLGWLVVLVGWLTGWIGPLSLSLIAIFATGSLLISAMLLLTGLLAELIVESRPDHSSQYSIVETTP